MQLRPIKEKLFREFIYYSLDYDINILKELKIYEIIIYKGNVFKIRKQHSRYLPCVIYDGYRVEISSRS